MIKKLKNRILKGTPWQAVKAIAFIIITIILIVLAYQLISLRDIKDTFVQSIPFVAGGYWFYYYRGLADEKT